MKSIVSVLIIIIISTSITGQTIKTIRHKGIKEAKSKVDANIPAVDKKTIEKWLYYMASDSMKGRKNGSPEMKITANWIAEKFKTFGLKTFKENDGYFQHYYIKKGKDSIPEQNVIGYIEGCNPELKKEYIIISAHFDHLGIVKPVMGDSINNGANDDASGICCLLGIAKTIQKMKAKPSRTLVFTAFSGEEISASGSRYFIKHTAFPPEEIYLNVNLEMVGLCTKIGLNNYSITGPDFSNLKDILNEYNRNSGWKLLDTMKHLDNLFFRADNVAFVGIKKEGDVFYGVPAHTFLTWNGEESLHKPFDEAGFINYDNLSGFTQYMSGVVVYLSKCKEEVNWTDGKLRRFKN